MSMDFMSLKAKLTLDDKEYRDGMDDAEGRAKGFKSKLAGGAKAVAKGFAVAGAAAATAVGAMTKAAVSGYAEMEQLKGGVETLFGDYASTVTKNANDAWKTAGMDANQYMETTIQSAAAMINSLGGDQKKAAEMSDMAITDMADNVNKMGTTMESVQDAYRGFSRGNFTMLDNLALGYAGTKEGMQQLLDKAMEIEKQQGRTTQFSIDSYADIVQAIHVVQNEMGITGTTAAEAEKTISGSLAAMKSAWQNLIVGFADPDANMDQLIGNVVGAAETAFGNLLPVIEKALTGIANFVEKIGPVIAERLPELVNQVLPALLDAANALLTALIKTLPETGMAIIRAIVDALGTAMPTLTETAVQMVAELAKGIGEALPELLPAVIEILMSIVTTLLDNIDLLVDAALQLAIGIADGLIEALPVIIDKIPYIISSIVAALVAAIPRILAAAIQLFMALVSGLVRVIPRIVAAIPALILAIVGGVAKGVQLMVKSGRNLVAGLWKGIRERWSRLISDFKRLAMSLPRGIKRLFKINSPSKVFEDIGKGIDEGLALGITRNVDLAEDAINTLGNTMINPMYAEMPVDTNEAIVDVLNMPAEGSNSASGRDLTVILELDRMQLGKAVYRLNNEESQRVGINLAGGFA